MRPRSFIIGVGRRFALCGLMLIGALCGSGCGLIWNIGPGGMTPSLVHNTVVYPNPLEEPMEYEIPYDPSVLEIVGWVQTERDSEGLTVNVPIVGDTDLIGVDASDYGEAVELLLKVHQLDGLLNVVVDTQYWHAGLYYIGVNRTRTIVGGVGYRFRNGAPGAFEPPVVPLPVARPVRP